MKKTLNYIVVFALVSTPFLVMAMDFKGLISFIISDFITPVLSFLLAASVVFFLWNVVQFIRKSDQPEELEKFKSNAVWGIVAIAVMVSMWGLVNFVTSSFNPRTTPVVIPSTSGPIGAGGVTI